MLMTLNMGLGPRPAVLVRARIADTRTAIRIDRSRTVCRLTSTIPFKPTCNVMTHTITLIPGDGIGPEVTDAVAADPRGRRRVDRVGAPRWRACSPFERTGQPLPVELLDSIRRNKVALKGPVTTPVGEGLHERQRRAAQGARSVREPAAGLEPARRAVAVRRASTSSSCARTPRTCTPGLEHEVVPGVVESLKIITERASTRIARVRVRATRGGTAARGSPRSTRRTS